MDYAINNSRKFRDPGFFKTDCSGYYLLPFRFHKINSAKEVMVNEVGDFLIVPSGTADRIVKREIDRNDDLYSDLLANFFISEEPLPELIDILATRYRTKKNFLEHFTALHIFVVTLRCNHSCHYCQVSRVSENKDEFDMSLNDIEAGIRHMLRSPSPAVTMEFQGGEPLLAFDKIQYAVERALELNSNRKQINFVICTNVTLITNDALIFCQKHGILISTSLDGPAFLHNANRPKAGIKSYELVVGGINKCREVLGNDKVSALMTTTALSLNYPAEIIDCYRQNGFKNIFLRPISPYGFALKNRNKNKYETSTYLDFYKKGLLYIIDLNKKGEFFTEDYTAIILKKMLTSFSVGYVDLQSPAGMINSVVVFNYDGFVYASDESRMLAENGDITFRLGKITDTYESIFYGDQAKRFSQYWCNESLAGCSDCAYQPYCGADPVFHYATQGDFEGYRPTSAYCQKNMEIIRFLFELIDSDAEVLPVFYSWIRNRSI